MRSHTLQLTTTASPTAPARVLALCAQRGVDVGGIHADRLDRESAWRIELGVTVDDEAALELLICRLNRLVDVIDLRLLDEVSGPHAGRP